MLKTKLISMSNLETPFLSCQQHKPVEFFKIGITHVLCCVVPTGLTVIAGSMMTNAQPSPSLRLIVNSNLDEKIQPDANLTLREAIEIINGKLTISQLSLAEKAQVLTDFQKPQQNLITFNLPVNQTKINLTKELPPILAPAIIDGTTQPGYDENIETTRSKRCENKQQKFTEKIPQPIVTLTPAAGVEVLRGLTILSDNVTVRGLNFYGFNSRYQNRETAVATVLPANILITDTLPPESINKISYESLNKPLQIPKNVLIEKNQFGVGAGTSSRTIQELSMSNSQYPLSAFGILVFKSQGTTIRQNQINNHTGSGIITGAVAENTQIFGNIIENNGFSGMPNAIHFEGKINNSEITENLICGNAGSGIFLFKPEGATQIRKNDIVFNGLQKQTAAIYLMGVGHQVIENQISEQKGPGVVVAAYPQSYRNKITANTFANIEGLSIDLTTQINSSISGYLIGDGPNSQRNSYYRREETGNAAVNTPEFLAREFLILGDKVNIDGKADPETTIEIYRVILQGNTKSNYGPLSEIITTVKTDKEGRFGVSLKNLKAGDVISAIATDSDFGTSEPALNAAIKNPL